jgi:hypothetical protein
LRFRESKRGGNAAFFYAGAHDSYPGLRQRFHNYAVFVKGKNFTVMQPTDSAFPKYFCDRCVAPEEVAPSPEHKMQGIVARLLHWLDQPVTGAESRTGD